MVCERTDGLWYFWCVFILALKWFVSLFPRKFNDLRVYWYRDVTRSTSFVFIRADSSHTSNFHLAFDIEKQSFIHECCCKNKIICNIMYKCKLVNPGIKFSSYGFFSSAFALIQFLSHFGLVFIPVQSVHVRSLRFFFLFFFLMISNNR